MNTRHHIAVILLTLAGSHSAFSQGALTPPGAPGPTMRSLEQVEPRTPVSPTNTPGDDTSEFIINQPGSYYLTGNVSGAKTVGIRFLAADVTLDLNGFQIRKSDGPGTGIEVAAAAGGCVIKNGSITGFPAGINALFGGGSRAPGGTISQVTISGAQFGATTGQGWLVERCVFINNATNGITAHDGTLVINCSASRGAVGFSLRERSTAIGCSAAGTAVGFLIDVAATARNCSAVGSTDEGFVGGNDATVESCTADSNKKTGIRVGARSIVRDSRAANNGNGTGASSVGDGINAGEGSTVQNCNALNNKGAGIQVAIGSTVTGSTARSNGRDGILAPNDCLITRNSCTANGTAVPSAGIRTTVVGNRIEENHVVFNSDAGIRVDAASNVIVRNTARFHVGDKNYVIAVGNILGTVVTSSADMNAANNSNVNISY